MPFNFPVKAGARPFAAQGKRNAGPSFPIHSALDEFAASQALWVRSGFLASLGMTTF
jgi:hypothetical protein